MKKARKVELLYKKAKGISINMSLEETMELRKYKVETKEGDFYTTKSNIKNYIEAVDNGTRLSFYDWCMNNNKADRRRKGASVEEMKHSSKELGLATMFFGWLTWGMAIYWIFQENLSVGVCAIFGAVISVILCKSSRRNAVLTVFVLPLLIAAIFGSR